MGFLVWSSVAVALSLLLPGEVFADNTGLLLAVGSSLNSSRVAWGQGQIDVLQQSTRAVSTCYTCSGTSCQVQQSCTSIADAVCITGFVVGAVDEMKGCATKSLCEAYAEAYSCNKDGSLVGFCCCSTNNCNSDVNTCRREIVNRCNGGGRVGGSSWVLALPLVTMSGFLLR